MEYPLALAIIHIKSSFNPMAVSYIPAYGLMQIVPQTAGRDVTKNLFGKPMILTPSYLFNKKNNINIGTGYFISCIINTSPTSKTPKADYSAQLPPTTEALVVSQGHLQEQPSYTLLKRK